MVDPNQSQVLPLHEVARGGVNGLREPVGILEPDRNPAGKPTDHLEAVLFGVHIEGPRGPDDAYEKKRATKDGGYPLPPVHVCPALALPRG